MTGNDSPAVARRRLRLALRKARDDQGLTQGQVADALDWSLSKVIRIEKGDVAISITDLRALADLLQVDEPDVVQQMIADARTSRRRGWWDEPRFREHLSAATLQLLQFEGEATAIRTLQPLMIPGILQTRAYAETILDAWKDEIVSSDDWQARLEARIQRADHVFHRPDPPLFLAIVDESAVTRQLGGARVMSEQLSAVQAVAQLPTVSIRVLPFTSGIAPTHGSFTILDLGDEENAILYRESTSSDEIVHASDLVRRHRLMFERLWDMSLSPEASGRLIEAHKARMRASLDTRADRR